MSEGKGSRRAVAELRWEAGAEPVERVGGRSLHQYWPVLSPYFRDVLLPPVRRTDEDAVSWTWREPEGAKPVSAGELRALRKRLASEQEWLAENLSRVEGGGGGMQGLAAAMAGMVERLVEGSDAELAGYVARTEAGVRLHSWGARTPARVRYPDTVSAEAEGSARGSAGDGREEGRKRRRGVIFALMGAGAAIMVSGGVMGVAWRKRAGEESEAARGEARVAVGTAQEEAKVKEVARATSETAMVREVTGVENFGGRGAATEAAEVEGRTTSAEAVGRSRPQAQRAAQEEEKRGMPLTPKGRPDQKKAEKEGGRGGAMRAGDSEKTREAGAEVLAASEERVEKKSVREEKPEEVRRARVDRAEPTAVNAGESRAGAGELRSDEDGRETRVREGEEPRGDGGGGEVRESAPEAKAWGASVGWREVRVGMPRWETRMLADAIVPTRPVRLGEVAAVGSLRERMLAEARARMPVTLREWRWRGGVGFEIAGGNAAGWRWRGASGDMREGRAEWEWSEGARVLEDASGGVVAEVRTAEAGDGWVILVREGVRVYRWIAVEIAAGERDARWSWRRVGGAGMPEGATVRAGKAAEARVDLALAVAEPLAFFDRESGWAAVGELSRRNHGRDARAPSDP